MRFRPPTERLVVYAGEGHGIARPENRQDLLRRATEWFQEQLGDR
jgi:dipeptidyl aminopeptidase/acylaminoacyl peptidase